MLETPYPYMQPSANQLLNMLARLVEIYTNTLVVIGVLLLILLLWLCVSELQQSKRSKQASRRVRANPSRQMARHRLLEDSLF